MIEQSIYEHILRKLEVMDEKLDTVNERTERIEQRLDEQERRQLGRVKYG
ncbi:hypothetical protein [Sediminibacillus massiliensis]|nr:hypothetical protein [Sediminibacillus massiliensis]